MHLSNKAQFTGGDMPTTGIFTGSAPPETMSAFIASSITSANTALAGTGIKPATGGTATYVNGGGAVNPNQYVMTNGYWVVDKQLQSFTDDLRFTFDVVPGNKLTVGGYLAVYHSDDTWYLGNNELMTATPELEPDRPHPEQRRHHLRERPHQRLDVHVGRQLLGPQCRAVRHG